MRKHVGYITLILIAAGLFYVYAEKNNSENPAAAVNEILYDKSTVPVDDTYACQVGIESACEVPVLLNISSKQIVYFWHAKDGQWIKAGDQQAALQALYDKREDIRKERAAKEAMDTMNKYHQDSMGSRTENYFQTQR